MKKTVYLAAVLVLYLKLVFCDKTTIVAPPDEKGPAVGFFIIPGASIGADQYLPLATEIQTNNPVYSIWVATVGGWVGNLVNPLQMKGFIEDTISNMRKEGLPDSAPVFLAAHSLGGVFLDMFVRQNPLEVAGVVLYGSYISHSVKLRDYPVPVITMTGDQDGMCRMTRIIKDFGQLPGYNHKTPVIVVPGVNHSQIASGPMPQLVETNDLIADKTEKEAHSLLANITNAFLTMNGPATTNIKEVNRANLTLQSFHNSTAKVAKPFLRALEMDGEGMNSWANLVAVTFSGVISTNISVDAYGVSVNDATFLASDPEVSFLSDANITFSVPMHNDMPLNPMDISLAQQTPTQQLVKTFSRKSIKKYLPKALYSNLPRSCNDTNLMGSELMSLRLPANYLSRYMSKGRQLLFKPDTVLTNVEEWFVSNTDWDKRARKHVYITSPRYSDGDIIMCKVITGSRFLEWMLIDSFKKS